MGPINSLVDGITS